LIRESKEGRDDVESGARKHPFKHLIAAFKTKANRELGLAELSLWARLFGYFENSHREAERRRWEESIGPNQYGAADAGYTKPGLKQRQTLKERRSAG
jgi:hypothetical protein